MFRLGNTDEPKIPDDLQEKLEQIVKEEAAKLRAKDSDDDSDKEEEDSDDANA